MSGSSVSGDAAVRAIALRLAGRLGPARVVVIDGRSGSGKTSLAAELARRMGAGILRVEDLYPGWEGLAEGSRAVVDALRTGAYRRYDWVSERFANELRIDAGRPLVIEGCGSVRRETLVAASAWAARSGAGTLDAADAGPAGSPRAVEGEAGWRAPRGGASVLPVWIEAPAALRRERALARDGEVFRPHWERWAAQEERLFAETRPIALAAEILHTA